MEWIGEIPSGWETIRLGMLGVFSSSGIDKKIIEGERTVRMVNYTDLIQSRRYYPIQTGEKDFMRVTTPESKMKEHRLERGDMVFIPSSETHEDLGYSSLIDFEEDDIVYSYHILRYKTKKPVFHYFKKYLVNHHSVLNQFSKECKGTTRQIIGRDVFNNVRVVLPSLSEQQQIVSFLDSKTSQIDELIQKKERKIELLKEYRTSLINQVVTKGLNPNVEMKDSGVEWIGDIPKDWLRTKLHFLKSLGEIEYQDGNHGSVHPKSEDFTEGGIPFLRPTDVFQNYISKEKLKYIPEDFVERLRIGFAKKGDLIFVNRGNIGVTTILTEFDQCDVVIINPQLTYLRSKEEIIIIKYLFFQSQSKVFQTNRDLKLGNGSVLNFLGLGDLGDYEVVLPPLSEQKQIVEYLDKQTQKIDSSIQKEEKKIELLKEYRQSLISSVVTGKIDVRTN